LSIVLSVLRFTASDNPIGIFKLFLAPVRVAQILFQYFNTLITYSAYLRNKMHKYSNRCSCTSNKQNVLPQEMTLGDFESFITRLGKYPMQVNVLQINL
jgi:hypothetical protein